MKNSFTLFCTIFGAIIFAVQGTAQAYSQLENDQQPLPNRLISISTHEGSERLKNSEALADYQNLAASYKAQNQRSYCGVASSVSVLGSLGIKTNQDNFFTTAASQVRTQNEVMSGGMTLDDLADLLETYGAKVSVNHAEEFNIDQFRKTLESNLATKNNYLIVNYQRQVLGQGRVGHISPVSAYDRESDSVLIMDTAAHKYPHTWVPVKMLFDAMKTIDSDSGLMRGFVEVSNN